MLELANLSVIVRANFADKGIEDGTIQAEVERYTIVDGLSEQLAEEQE